MKNGSNDQVSPPGGSIGASYIKTVSYNPGQTENLFCSFVLSLFLSQNIYISLCLHFEYLSRKVCYIVHLNRYI